MLRSSAAVALLAVFVAGCGDAKEPQPVGSPRATVMRFLDDLQGRRIERACATLAPEVIPLVRANVLDTAHVPRRLDAAARRAWVQRLNASTKRCSVSLGLLAKQLSGSLPAVRSAAARGSIAKPFPADIWVLGNQDWVLEPRNGRWVITSPDALFVAQELRAQCERDREAIRRKHPDAHVADCNYGEGTLNVP